MKNFTPTVITPGTEYRFSDYSKKNFAGNIGYKFNGRYVEYSIHSLDEFDTQYVSGCTVKEGETFFRCRSTVSDITSKWGFIVKINVLKGLVYFLTENGYENDVLEFETKGIQLIYMNWKK